MARVLIDHKLVVQITENHGGYLGASCLICNAGGWLDGKFGYKYNAKNVMSNRLKHKKKCPMNKYAADGPSHP